jgi:hypothetical protein
MSPQEGRAGMLVGGLQSINRPAFDTAATLWDGNYQSLKGRLRGVFGTTVDGNPVFVYVAARNLVFG